jgi:LysM repeat protein
MKQRARTQRILAAALAVALLATMTLVSASGLAVVEQEMLVNGSFEGGFYQGAGLGAVGNGWSAFTNGGSIVYGYFDDQWAPVVADGSHSQLIELNTMGQGGSEPDRYTGIYQTISLVKGATYQFKMKGLMREANPWPNDEKYRYRVQWGYTPNGSTDWTQVTNWAELPWDKIDERTAPTGMESFSTSFVAPSDKITIYIRVWKKWGTTQKEIDVNLDAISLWGPRVGQGTVIAVPPPAPPPPAQQGTGVVQVPPAGGQPAGNVVVVPSQGGNVIVVPQSGSTAAAACSATNLLANGNFESGFTNGVGNSWGAWPPAGPNYGFYDEQWTKVIKEGAHDQLIEINSKGLSADSPNRTALIYQRVSGLVPGATYQFSLWGMMREEAAHPGEDPYRYRVLWGYAAADPNPSIVNIANWTELPWNNIYVREAPGDMSYFSVQFQAPASTIVIGVEALKKWPDLGRELDVNLDAIQLNPCNTTGVTAVIPVPPGPNQCFVYAVKRGDSVSKIAARYGDTVKGIVSRNKLANANRIYPGQKLTVCDPK